MMYVVPTNLRQSFLRLPQKGYIVRVAVSPLHEEHLMKKFASIVAYAAIAGTVKGW